MATAFPLPTRSELEIPLRQVPAELKRLTEESEAYRQRFLKASEEAFVLRQELQDARDRESAARSAARVAEAKLADSPRFVLLSRRLSRAMDALAKLLPEVADRELLADVLNDCEIAQDCEECRGSGLVADEEMVGDPGDWHGHRIRSITSECDAKGCFAGRVLR